MQISWLLGDESLLLLFLLLPGRGLMYHGAGAGSMQTCLEAQSSAKSVSMMRNLSSTPGEGGGVCLEVVARKDSGLSRGPSPNAGSIADTAEPRTDLGRVVFSWGLLMLPRLTVGYTE